MTRGIAFTKPAGGAFSPATARATSGSQPSSLPR